MTTGERIKVRRKELELSADYLAEKLGCSRSTIFRYENGEIEKIPAKLLSQIAQILHTSPAQLLGHSGKFSANNALPEGNAAMHETDDVEQMVNELLSDLMDNKGGTLMLDGKPSSPQALEFLRQSIRANLEYAIKLNEESAGVETNPEKSNNARPATRKNSAEK